MKNSDKWKESKFVLKKGKLCASSDSKEVMGGSWLNVQLLADLFNRLIPKYVNGKLLDLGCGKVPLYALYKQYISESVCVDWDNSLHGNVFLDVTHDISKKLPFENSSFDTVICSDVLEHVYNPKDVLGEMVRVVKPEGYIIITTPFNYWMHEMPYDYFRYTTSFYKEFAKENPMLEVEYIEPIGGMKAVLFDIIGKKISARSHTFARWLQKFIYCMNKGKKIGKSPFLLEIGVVYKKVQS